MSNFQIHVFISHAWRYSGHYEKLSEWIFEENWSVGKVALRFLDYSVPKDDPIHYVENDAQLTRAIFNKIIMSHVVVIPTGMYAAYSKWIQKEIRGALKLKKPILAVVPYGQERKASVVLRSATEVVGWNKQSVVNAIWRLFRERMS